MTTAKITPTFLLLLLLLLLNPSHPMPIIPLPDLPPVSLPAPPPTAGGDFSPRPRGWGRLWVSSSPSHFPDNAGGSNNNNNSNNNFQLLPRKVHGPAAAPTAAPKEGIPFLSSNPAVPLPTGMTDSASIRPLPTPGDGKQEVGLGSSSIRVKKLLLVFVMMFSAVGLWI